MLKTQLEANLNVLINNIYMELKQTGKYYRYIHVALREFKIELRTSTTKTTVFITCRPVIMDAVKKLCEIFNPVFNQSSSKITHIFVLHLGQATTASRPS